MIIFVGPAGAGKTIQGRLLAQKIGADYFSIGELLRQNMDPEIQEKMLTGSLINDQDVIRVLDDVLPRRGQVRKECILDGFPRSVAQAEWLVDQIRQERIDIKGVIHLRASTETTIPRLLERGRPDDTPAAINVRVGEYDHTILPIIEQLKTVGIKIDEINAEQPIELVQQEIISKLKLATD